MQKGHCLNCGAALYPKDNYCGTCGQKADTRRFTYRELFHQLIVTITNAEKGIWKLIKGLAIRPGTTAAEFADGKRKRYYNPFAFLAVVLTITVLMNSWFKPYNDPMQVDQKVLNSITTPHKKEVYVEGVRRFNDINGYIETSQRIFTLICTPYYAFFLLIFFRKRNRNMAEISVAYILFSAFIFLATALLFQTWQGTIKNTKTADYISYISMILENFYLAWGFNGFFKINTVKGYFKLLAVITILGIIGFLIIMTLIILYVYQGEVSILWYLGGQG